MATIEQTLQQITEMEDRISILKTVAGYLRARYVSRDGNPPLAKLASANGRVVSEDVIDVMANEYMVEAKEIEAALKQLRMQEIK